MTQKIKEIKLETWIIFALLIAFAVAMWVKPDPVVKQDYTEIYKRMDASNKRVDSLKYLLTKSDLKLDSLHKIQKKTDQTIINIIKNEKDEKFKLDQSSDDDNVRYFHEYVNWFRTSSRDSTAFRTIK